jgi:hypothetical protein
MKNPIKEYFRRRTQRKAYKKFEKELLSNPKRLIDTQAKFEIAFGKDQITRTAKQWASLVRVYGMEEVKRKESMEEAEITRRCGETFSQRFHRMTIAK